MENCIFCKIINRKLPADITCEDDIILVFKDINPKAKIHQLLIPKLHIKSLLELKLEHQNIINHAIYKIPEIAKQLGLTGFRTIINTGKDGGQIVDHLHFHILSPV